MYGHQIEEQIKELGFSHLFHHSIVLFLPFIR